MTCPHCTPYAVRRPSGLRTVLPARCETCGQTVFIAVESRQGTGALQNTTADYPVPRWDDVATTGGAR